LGFLLDLARCARGASRFSGARSIPNTYSDTDANNYLNADEHRFANTDPDCNRHFYPNGNGDGYIYCYSNTDRVTDSYGYTHRHGVSVARCTSCIGCGR
jgi:hypothetical protein